MYNGLIKGEDLDLLKLLIPSNELNNSEFFCVHYSNINTTNYKTLYPGNMVHLI